MSTPRQIEASRVNARGSTGPRTDGGKARTSRNARRHGLSVPIGCDPALSTEVEELVRHLVGDAADADVWRARSPRRRLTSRVSSGHGSN
jgi:hypothetical protein